MYAFLLVVHVFVCIVLIAVVLLQAGRGGGMSEMGGGASTTSSILGTQTSTFMMRATEICAIIFVVTSLSLAVLSAQRGKSLIEGREIKVPTPAVSAVAAPVQAPTTEEAVPASAPADAVAS